MSYKSLVINLGSTSTKVAIFEDKEKKCVKDLPMPVDELANCNNNFDQYESRRKAIDDFVSSQGMEFSDFDFIASRGAGGGHQKSGAYVLDKAYAEYCYEADAAFPHPLNVGPVIAYDISTEYGIPAFTYDAPGVDEYIDYAKVTGNKNWECILGGHPLNSNAVCRKAAAELGKKYEECDFVVCHAGGGVSTSAHVKGHITDSISNAFTPDRVGCVTRGALLPFIKLCYSGRFTLPEMIKQVNGKGGFVSYLGTSNIMEVERRMKSGDEEAGFYYRSMIYALSKDIGAISVCCEGRPDGIILTGGIANSEFFVEEMKKHIAFLAPVFVYPGSLEMEALAEGCLRAFLGEEATHHYGKV